VRGKNRREKGFRNDKTTEREEKGLGLFGRWYTKKWLKKKLKECSGESLVRVEDLKNTFAVWSKENDTFQFVRLKIGRGTKGEQYYRHKAP